MFHASTATDYIDLFNQLMDLAASDHVSAAAISAGGTGYTAGDILTVSGGTFTHAATIEVLTVSSGAVATAQVINGGAYTVDPTNPASTTGGTGTGATFNLTLTFTGWTVHRDQVISGSNREAILEGEGSGSDSIFVGIRTFDSSPTYFNWELAGMTGFNSGLSFSNQPGISPGRYDGATSTEQDGAYTLLKNGAMNYWFFIDGSRILGIFKADTTYANMYLGFVDRLSTSVGYPYPLLVMGSSSQHNRSYTTNQIGHSGMLDPIAASDEVGPGFIYQPGGGWASVANGFDSGSGRTARMDCIVLPCGMVDITIAPTGPIPKYDKFVHTSKTWDDFIPNTGDPGSQNFDMYPTPDSGGARSNMVPGVVLMQSPVFQFLGQFRGVYWVGSSLEAGSLSAENLLTEGSDVFIVFNNCLRTERWTRFAVKRA